MKLETAQRTGTIRLAVVEDDPEYRDAILVPVLSRAGFEVVGMGSALELYRAMLAEPYDLVLLDVGLPDDDGFAIAGHLRGLSPSIGIVMLTGRSSGADRMRGLEAGVDAYIAKPADMQEVVATLRNLAIRISAEADSAAQAADTREPGPTATGASGWGLDEGGWRIRGPDGDDVVLSLAERRIMETLAATPGVPVSRDALIGRLVENIHDFDPHRLEMLVYRLRRKCRKQLGLDLPLKAVRGVGYMLAW
ncbi:MAG TPA: response regulator transcription factor [Pseudomonas sp.]|nr:response regulator transcription factor [Pseudomonas sp.]